MNRTSQFEVHLTVAIAQDAHIERLSNWAAANGAKVSHIVLDRGDHSSQPMVTLWFTGTLEDALAAMHSASYGLKSNGFEVSREKVEVGWESYLVPQSQSDLDRLGANAHFEFHIKLRLRTKDLADLARKLEGTEARLSRNARRIHADEFQERFVTQRSYGVAKPVASNELDRLVAYLASTDWQLLEIEREFVVFDSNLSLDRGWICTPQGAINVQ